MTDERDPLEAVRQIRPDRLLFDDPNDPWMLAEGRDRLLSLIHQTGVEPSAAWTAPAVYPRLGYEDEVGAIEFLTRAFGFVERREARVEHSNGHVLAWLHHDDGIIMISHVQPDVHGLHSPRQTGGATCMLNVRVRDVDAHYQRARAEGAIVTMELNDAFYGERMYEAEDPEGNRWHFGEPRSRVGHPIEQDLTEQKE